MFVLDDITLIVGIAVLLLAIIVPFVNVLVVRLKGGPADCGDEEGDDDAVEMTDNGAEKQLPGISVVVTVEEDGEELRDNLPLWLGQEYAGEFQVIVVVCGNDELTENTLKRYSSDKHLYTTFIPSSSRYMSRRKLAITVGVKAAKYDWVLLTDVDCKPDTDRCLQTMAGNCSQTTDLVAGYSGFDEEYLKSRRFDHVYDLYRQLAAAQKGKAWGYCGNIVLFRKKMFIDGKGFDGNLKYIRGEYDFIINKFSTADNTIVELSPKASVTEDDPTDKTWHNKNLFYMSTRKQLTGTRHCRLFFNTTMWAMWIAYLFTVAAVAFSVLTERWILTAAAGVALVLTLVLRAVVLSKSIRRYLDGMSLIRMLWLEAMIPMRKLARIIRYKRADKYDFISHKI